MTAPSVMAAVAATAASAAVVAIVLVGSEGAGDQRAQASTQAPWRPPPKCPVTIPNGSTPPGESSPEHHGNGKLWTGLRRRGTFLVARPSSPEYYGPHGQLAVDGGLGHDGSVGIKAPWWRGPGVRGRVRIRARRLDAAAPRVDYTVPPSGYGLTGFQAMGLGLPTVGCWRVTGSVGKARLSFVTLVWRARP
jgi:hypothetical protein